MTLLHRVLLEINGQRHVVMSWNTNLASVYFILCVLLASVTFCCRKKNNWLSDHCTILWFCCSLTSCMLTDQLEQTEWFVMWKIASSLNGIVRVQKKKISTVINHQTCFESWCLFVSWWWTVSLKWSSDCDLVISERERDCNLCLFSLSSSFL